MSEFAAAIADHIREACRMIGIDPGAASRLASAVVQSLRASHGGERHYLPTADDGKRDEALRMLSMGHDPKEIARKLRVDLSTVYRWRQALLRHRRGDPARRRGLAKSDDWLL
jgi:Mor family transcriptional regulator